MTVCQEIRAQRMGKIHGLKQLGLGMRAQRIGKIHSLGPLDHGIRAQRKSNIRGLKMLGEDACMTISPTRSF